MLFFLTRDLSADDVDTDEVVDMYCELDDTELLYTIKRWVKSTDRVLSDLCRRFLTRDFFRVSFLDQQPTASRVAEARQQVQSWLVESGIAAKDEAGHVVDLYFSADLSHHSPYEPIEDSILVLERDGRLLELSEVADTTTVSALRRFEVKPYFSYPKGSL
ncbi:MAG: hypothetical protein R3178_09270 [Rhodothermales bacterium]|nr:hypothetical protein [Rhodothermales bacterium]